MATMSGVMPRVTGEIRETAAWSIVPSVLMMIAGVLAVAIPPVAGLAVTVMFGWLLIINGALHVGYAWRVHGFAAALGETVLAVLYAAIDSINRENPLETIETPTNTPIAQVALTGQALAIIAATATVRMPSNSSHPLSASGRSVNAMIPSTTPFATR